MGHKAPESLTHVGALIGVSSCKGGVGKSTIATNLAFAIAAIGGRVGLIDADVYGPSLPSLVRLEDDPNPTPNPKPDPNPNQAWPAAEAPCAPPPGLTEAVSRSLYLLYLLGISGGSGPLYLRTY